MSFRFTYSDTNDDSFLPVALRPDAPEQLTCQHWALSFFGSRKTALARWARLCEREDAASRYGDSLSVIDLVPSDGLAEEPHAKSGHFGLHEYASAPALAKRIKKTEPLPFPKKTK